MMTYLWVVNIFTGQDWLVRQRRKPADERDIGIIVIITRRSYLKGKWKRSLGRG